ncbi:keratin-associated protein 16-3-like [Contarinia nasturtii]|uniref:keratin-associated protein 16-3-like n=1 Tax=Contarinia nasturtii TaxID=265458 RepID=UPI0012D40FEC|nr:keratin-associated protein 16-3-like [Contarinia nasturtii]
MFKNVIGILVLLGVLMIVSQNIVDAQFGRGYGIRRFGGGFGPGFYGYRPGFGGFGRGFGPFGYGPGFGYRPLYF